FLRFFDLLDFTIWVPPVYYCGRVSPPFITGFPDGFFFNFDSTCKIQVLIFKKIRSKATGITLILFRFVLAEQIICGKK
ncbi:MAG: hypothetical protein ABIK15_21370, partial [Pseudomonadota bacterium]